MEFVKYPKTPRLFKDMTVTEKIDGTNACVVIKEAPEGYHMGSPIPEDVIDLVSFEGKDYFVAAQSKNRMITPGKGTDNVGFAAWVDQNAYQLVYILGPGYHYGEWWGSGIQRNYGLTDGERRFSLFNTDRWFQTGPDGLDSRATRAGLSTLIDEIGAVPVLYQGVFSEAIVMDVLDDLNQFGSVAAPGFMNPEGIIVYFSTIKQVFKVTLDGDVGKWKETA